MNEKEALVLLRDLWGDLSNPNFIWQVLALVLCLGLASLVALWWRRNNPKRSRTLHAAGTRLAFPMTALILVAGASLILRPFFSISLLKVALPLLGTLALIRLILYVLRRTFPGAAWLASWERLIALIVWGWLAIYITNLDYLTIDFLEQFSINIGRQRVDLWMILHGFVTVFLTVVVALWLAGLAENRLGASTMDSSLRIVLVRVLKAVLFVVAILLSLSLVGIDMTALSVFTGALGVGLGLGLQKIASNYVAGFILLLDRSIRIGNLIQIDANTGGAVSQITTRYTVLRNLSGIEFIIPNETLISNIFQNQTYTDRRVRVAIPVGVAYDTDLEEAMAVMKAAASAHPRVQKDPAPSVLLLRFGDSSIDLELGFWIVDPEVGFAGVRSDISLAIWRTFREKNIEIPFPQREVRILGAEARPLAEAQKLDGNGP